MTTILSTVYASAPGNLIYTPTLELISADTTQDPVYLINGYYDQVATLESGQTVTFKACGMTPSLPKQDASGRQSLKFAIDNVFGYARLMIDKALEAGGESFVVYRAYVAPDWSGPQDIYRLTLAGAELSDGVLTAEAAYQDLLNQLWQRLRYDAEFAPGLKHFN
jgi:hypothetical protein